MKIKILNVFTTIALIAGISGCAINTTEPTKEVTPVTTVSQVESYFKNLSKDYTDRTKLPLDSKLERALKLIDKSDGKVSDGNVSRSALSSYVGTVKSVLKRDIGDTVKEHVSYRHKVVFSFYELDSRMSVVNSEMSKWTGKREEVISGNEKHKDSVNSGKIKISSLEKEVRNNANKQKQIELKRAEEQRKYKAEVAAKKKAAQEAKQRQEEEAEESEKQKQEDEAAQALENSVTVTVNGNFENSNGSKILKLTENAQLVAGSVVKVNGSNGASFYQIDFVEIFDSLEDVDNLSVYDAVFVYEIDDSVIVAVGMVKTA